MTYDTEDPLADRWFAFEWVAGAIGIALVVALAIYAACR